MEHRVGILRAVTLRPSPRSAPNRALWRAVRADQPREAARALAAGAHADVSGRGQATPLFHAVTHEQRRMCTVLLDAGAQPWGRADAGGEHAPIVAAAKERKLFFFRLLMGWPARSPFPSLSAQRWWLLFFKAGVYWPRLGLELLNAAPAPQDIGSPEARWLTLAGCTDPVPAMLVRLERLPGWAFPERSACTREVWLRLVATALQSHPWVLERVHERLCPTDLFEEREAPLSRTPRVSQRLLARHWAQAGMDLRQAQSNLRWLLRQQGGRELLCDHLADLAGSACSAGSLQRVRLLLQAAKLPLSILSRLRDENKATMLHRVCERGVNALQRRRLLRLLLHLGVEVDVKDAKGRTALDVHAEALTPHPVLLETLHEAGTQSWPTALSRLRAHQPALAARWQARFFHEDLAKSPTAPLFLKNKERL